MILSRHQVEHYPSKPGGVSFETINEAKCRVELIVYPTGRPDGWVRWYYIYEIENQTVEPIKAYREYDTSDWTGEAVFFTGIIGFVAGGVVGFVLIIMGVIFLLVSRKQ